MTHVLPRLAPGDGSLGMYLGLTGARLNGTSDLTFCGLATHGIDSCDIDALVDTLVAVDPAAASSPEAATAAVKGILDRFSDGRREPSADADEKKKPILADNMPAIERCFGSQHASIETMIAALEQEVSGAGVHSSWAAQTLKLLTKASPLSLKVTLRLLREHSIGSGVSLARALETEYTVSQRCMRPGGGGKSDFYEGIRAVLVDKGNPPARWSPEALAEVTSENVDNFFEPLDESCRLRLS
jgi:enoyl-CoA hydratase/carnithine racemase